MENKMTIEFTDKKHRLFTILLLIILLIIVSLSSLFNFYPGSYSFEASNYQVFIENGTLKKESYNFTITKDNELRIALLKNEINHLKTLWYVSVLFIGTILIGLANFLRVNSKIAFTITLLVFISVVILTFPSYMDSINYIETLILNLKSI